MGSVGGIGQSNIQQFDQQGDGQFGFDELKNIFKDISGEDNLTDNEAAELARHVLGNAETIDFETLMNILDSDDNNQIEADEISLFGDLGADQIGLRRAEARAESFDDNPNGGDNVFTLSGVGTSFTFEFREEYEADLANLLDDSGGLDAESLSTFLENNDISSDPKAQAVVSMALLAVGLDEGEVSFIMDELVTSPTSGNFTVQDLIDVADRTSVQEENNALEAVVPAASSI